MRLVSLTHSLTMLYLFGDNSKITQRHTVIAMMSVCHARSQDLGMDVRISVYRTVLGNEQVYNHQSSRDKNLYVKLTDWKAIIIIVSY